MLVEPHGERFLRTTRGRIVALLRRSSRTVDELAQALGVSDSAIRVHLTSLERDGLVRRGGRRRGPSKPAYAYELTPDAERLFPRAYDLVLHRLLDVLSERLPPAALEEWLREVGGRLALERAARAPQPGAGGFRARLDDAQAVFASLGGQPEIEEQGGNFVFRSYSCPLAAVVSDYPQACKLAESLLATIIAAPVRERCPRARPLLCVFDVAGTPNP